MLRDLLILALSLQSVAARSSEMARRALQQRQGTGFFNPPTTTAFATLDLAVNLPVNATTPNGVVCSAANFQGNVTGGIVATILPVGAGFERVARNEQGEHSFYENRYHLLAPNNDTFTLDVQGILHYDNEALHGFMLGKFETTAAGYEHINYRHYIVEVTGDYNTGDAHAEVFEILSNGRKDGKPIKALLPPGCAK